MVSTGPVVVYTAGVLLKPIEADTGWSRGEISAATTVAAVATALVSPVVGGWVDRFGGVATARVGVLLLAASLAVVGMGPASLPVFLVTFLCLGVLSATQTPLSYAHIIVAQFDKKRGLALAVALSGMGVGAASLPLLANALAELAGWRAAYFGLATVVLLVGGAATWLILSNRKVEARVAQPTNQDKSAFRTALTQPRFWTMAAAFFLVASATNAVVGHLPAILTDRGIDSRVAATVVSASGVSLLIGRLLGGYLLDHIQARWVASGVFALGALGTGIFINEHVAASITWAYVGGSLVGVAIGVETDLIAFMVSRFFGVTAFARLYGVQILCFAIGVGLGPGLLGAWFDAAGSYAPGLTWLTAACALAALLITFGGTPRDPSSPVSQATES
jgi:MFS family permease